MRSTTRARLAMCRGEVPGWKRVARSIQAISTVADLVARSAGYRPPEQDADPAPAVVPTGPRPLAPTTGASTAIVSERPRSLSDVLAGFEAVQAALNSDEARALRASMVASSSNPAPASFCGACPPQGFQECPVAPATSQSAPLTPERSDPDSESDRPRPGAAS